LCQSRLGGLLVTFADALLGQGLTEAGVLVVHAVLPSGYRGLAFRLVRHGPAGLLGRGVAARWADLDGWGRGWGWLGAEFKGEAGDDHDEGQGQGGQQG
jgi:hypothetical protein